VAGFGLTAPPPATAPRGVEATVARWSQDALEQLW
jgi:hypothetical protein